MLIYVINEFEIYFDSRMCSAVFAHWHAGQLPVGTRSKGAPYLSIYVMHSVFFNI